MDLNKKIELIKRNTVEIIGEEELKKLLKSKKEISVYWGTMPTGSPHISYYFPLLKVADLLRAGLRVKILLADLHAALDGVDWKVLSKRQKYYERLIKVMLKTIGVNINKLEFVEGSKIQLNGKYFQDVLKLSTITSVHDATKSASEVVKLGDNPKLGGIIYPVMQALDEEYLKVDAQLGGLDQRKILVYAREFLPKIGYKPRIEIMHPIVRGLIGEKMSSSVEGSKIDMMDDEETIKRKINHAVMIAKDSNNGLMAFLKFVTFVIKKDNKEKFVLKRDKKYGGYLKYTNYNELEEDYISGKIHPLDLKNAIAKEMDKLVEPVRKDSLLRKLYKEAYK